jgi:RING-H2 zinc finger protein RHA1
MGIPLVCYCLAVPKPVIAFCRLLSATKDAALLMLAVVGLCRLPPDDADASHQHQQPGEVKTRLPTVEYGQLLAEHEQPSDDHGCDGDVKGN